MRHEERATAKRLILAVGRRLLGVASSPIHPSAGKGLSRKFARTSNEGMKHTKRAGVLVPALGVAF
jgi:hypothetical protein